MARSVCGVGKVWKGPGCEARGRKGAMVRARARGVGRTPTAIGRSGRSTSVTRRLPLGPPPLRPCARVQRTTGVLKGFWGMEERSGGIRGAARHRRAPAPTAPPPRTPARAAARPRCKPAAAAHQAPDLGAKKEHQGHMKATWAPLEAALQAPPRRTRGGPVGGGAVGAGARAVVTRRQAATVHPRAAKAQAEA